MAVKAEAVPAAKLPPFSNIAEQGVLGGLMVDPTRYYEISEKVNESDFYTNAHRIIFRHLKDLITEDIKPDIITLQERLESASQLEQAGGLLYVGMLAKDVPSAANIVAYAKIVREKSLRRQMLAESFELAARAHNETGDDDIETLMSKSISSLMALQNNDEQERDIKDIAADVYKSFDDRLNSENQLVGLSTGIESIDKATGGLEPGLIVLMARPGMGKTTLATNIAEHQLFNEDLPVLFISIEMRANEIVERMNSTFTGISSYCLRNPHTLVQDDWAKLTLAHTNIRKLPLIIDDRKDASVISIVSKITKEYYQRKIGLVVIDYLQLIDSDMRDSRHAQINQVTKALAKLGKKLGIPIVALSQLNREIEKRVDKRPRMSDARESGSIEEDAYMILGLYRHVVYDPETPNKNKAELLILKNRNGPVKNLTLEAKLRIYKYEDGDNEEKDDKDSPDRPGLN